jgi:hypothetical protein
MYSTVKRVIGAAGSGLAILAIVAVALAPGAPRRAAAQPRAGGGRLTVGGTTAGSGVHPLRAGFSPDPFSVPVHATGAVDVTGLRLGAGCRGFASVRPDVIIRFAGAAGFLRIFARSTTDVALLVNDPSGRFRCNDDVMPGRDTNPMVDVYAPRAGQYDVWIGTPTARATVDATLFVTASRDQRP